MGRKSPLPCRAFGGSLSVSSACFGMVVLPLIARDRTGCLLWAGGGNVKLVEKDSSNLYLSVHPPVLDMR